MLPRLGRRIAANRVAVWTAGAVFLAAWLPFNNGLRPEPLIAFGVVAVWVLVENADRNTPAVAGGRGDRRRGVQRDAGTAGADRAGPAAGRRPGHRRDRRAGAAGRRRRARSPRWRRWRRRPSLIFVIVFRDQTLATVAESARIKYVVGPTIAWYQEFLRYYFLTVEDSVDGSLTRRFAVLVLLLCMFGLLAVLLRRGSLPGVASGPVWRLIGTTAIGLLLLTFTPTKWAVQFGAFAGSGRVRSAAVTAFAFARVGLHSRRNLALYVTALLFVLAWATSGINGWFYVGNYGVPWFDKQPVIAGIPVTTIFLVLAIADRPAGRLAALPDGLHRAHRGRQHPPQPRAGVHAAARRGHHHGGARGRARWPRAPRSATPSTPPARPTCRRSPSGLADTSCAMADDVLVEADTNAGMLQPVPGQRFGQYGPLGGENPVGFTPNGVSDALEPRRAGGRQPRHRQLRRLARQAERRRRLRGGHRRRLRPEGVNGSRVFLPFGLDPDRTPVMGSYGENTVAAKATSAWYQLPPRTPDRPLVTVAAAGAIWYYEEDAIVQLRPVAEAAMGRAPARRLLSGARRGPADRHLPAEGVAQPAVPVGQRRRRRPTWRASSPTTPTCPPISGSRSPRRGCRCCRPRNSSSGRRPRC